MKLQNIFQFDTIVPFETKFSDDFVCCDKGISSDDEVAVHLKNIRNSLPLSFLFNLDMTVPVILIFWSLSERSSVSIRYPFFGCLNSSTLIVQSPR